VWGLCGNIAVIAANGSGEQKKFTLAQLLPEPFGADSFQKRSKLSLETKTGQRLGCPEVFQGE
jgi:hypothetical protein